MPHKRFIRVIGYEGNEEWLKRILARRERVKFNRQGTIKELKLIELKDGEYINLDALPIESHSTSRG